MRWPRPTRQSQPFLFYSILFYSTVQYTRGEEIAKKGLFLSDYLTYLAVRADNQTDYNCASWWYVLYYTVWADRWKKRKEKKVLLPYTILILPLLPVMKSRAEEVDVCVDTYIDEWMNGWEKKGFMFLSESTNCIARGWTRGRESSSHNQLNPGFFIRISIHSGSILSLGSWDSLFSLSSCLLLLVLLLVLVLLL